ncbi:MAG: hypothetical protein A2293_12395 [Elusimicrobia bacterium RIFOXYB2_FULL_49_7]|nr:MAG: hypothetical protein A2293_12395 [Elusimicrobia bacterium RIFOXYB2_FULL_49_7]
MIQALLRLLFSSPLLLILPGCMAGGPRLIYLTPYGSAHYLDGTDTASIVIKSRGIIRKDGFRPTEIIVSAQDKYYRMTALALMLLKPGGSRDTLSVMECVEEQKPRNNLPKHFFLDGTIEIRDTLSQNDYQSLIRSCLLRQPVR